MLRTFPEIFRGTALEWYRVNRDSFQTWQEFQQVFLEHFLPPRFINKLEEEITRKRQGPREKAKDFIQATQYLILQHPGMRMNENIDRIYDSLRAEYRLYIRRRDFRTIGELIELAEEYEYVKQEERGTLYATPVRTNPFTRPRHEPRQPMRTPANILYDRSTHCWNCKQRGHNKANCRRPFRMFCSFCGEDGRLTKDCQCHPHQAAVMEANASPTSTNNVQKETKPTDTTTSFRLHNKAQSTESENLIMDVPTNNPERTDNMNRAPNPFRTNDLQPTVTADPRYFIPVRIYDRTFNALLDTGATKSKPLYVIKSIQYT